MALSQTQKAVWEKARALGSGGQAVRLTDAACAYLIARIAIDLGLLEHFPELCEEVPAFFHSGELDDLVIEGVEPLSLFERLVAINPDGDMYFACLANLHKARLKYETILEKQAIPTLEQVGPRGLLQYGKLSPSGLVAFLFWRKWFFDIDNRAGQETGYLFEPVIANAVGEVYIGAQAWEHLDQLAGPTMASFLERYVREPIDHLLREVPEGLPELRARFEGNIMIIALAGEEMRILRHNDEAEDDARDEAPDDLFGSDL